MSENANKALAKAEKKAAKAQAKALKQVAKQRHKQAELPSSPAPPTGPTPAERSAAAAERQVILHRRRFWVSLAGVLLTLVSLIVSILIWQLSQRNQPVAPAGNDEALSND